MPKRRKVDYAEARISTHLRGKRGGHHRLANMCLDCALHACDNPACTTTRPPSRCAPWLPLAASAPERWRRSWHGSKSTLRRPRGLPYIHSQPGGHYRGLAVRHRPLHPHALYIRCWTQIIAIRGFLILCFSHSVRYLAIATWKPPMDTQRTGRL